ncbi:MAG: thiamine pyrophosphate-dependent enzyme, partial [Bacillota bacterium]
MELTREDLLEVYRQMVLTRVFDTKTQAWHRKGLTRETIHASTGQEAICTGSCYGLRKTDMVMPSLRSRGAFFARGVDPRTILLAQTGKRGSPSDGHEASHHTAFPELGILAGTGIVGSSISIGVGAALASQIKGRDDVVLIFFG